MTDGETTYTATHIITLSLFYLHALKVSMYGTDKPRTNLAWFLMHCTYASDVVLTIISI